MSIQTMVTMCVYCGTEVPAGTQPELFECCGEIGRTEDVPADENEEANYYVELERGYAQDRV